MGGLGCGRPRCAARTSHRQRQHLLAFARIVAGRLRHAEAPGLWSAYAIRLSAVAAAYLRVWRAVGLWSCVALLLLAYLS